MLAEVITRGLFASGDDESFKYPEGQDTEIWKYKVLGMVPFTAHMDSLGTTPAPDIEFKFAEEPYIRNHGELTGIYDDTALATAYVSGGVEGSQLFAKTTATFAERLVQFMTLLIHDLDTDNMIRVEIMRDPVSAGANSYIPIKLLEDDDDAVLGSTNLEYTMLPVAVEEGSMLPESVNRDLVNRENYTQIWSASVSMTGSQEARPSYFSEPEFARQVRYMNEVVLKQQEMAYLFGKGDNTSRGAKGKPRRRMQGAVTELKDRFNSGEIGNRFYNFRTDADYAGYDWNVAGWDFTKKIMSETSELDTGVAVKKLYCGPGLWQGFADLLEDRVHYQWETAKDDFGYTIRIIHGLRKSIEIHQHPDFTSNALKNSGFLTEPGLCKLRPFRPMKVLQGKYEDSDGNVFEDQKRAGLLYEGSMEWHGLENMAWITYAPTNEA